MKGLPVSIDFRLKAPVFCLYICSSRPHPSVLKTLSFIFFQYRSFFLAVYYPRHNVPRIIYCSISLAIGLTSFLCYICLFGSHSVPVSAPLDFDSQSLRSQRCFLLPRFCFRFLLFALGVSLHPCDSSADAFA